MLLVFFLQQKIPTQASDDWFVTMNIWSCNLFIIINIWACNLFWKTLISQFLDKISKIWFVTFLARVPAIFKQKISPLASKLREPFKVTDGRTKFLPIPIGIGIDGQKFETLTAKLAHANHHSCVLWHLYFPYP